MLARRRFLVGLTAAFLAAGAGCRAPARTLGTPTAVAPGVELYRTADDSLVNHAGPIAVSLLKLDPAIVKVQSALSNREVMHADTVDGIARSVGAIAAINGGYFNRSNGEPIGLLKVGGELVSDTGWPRGAVAIRTDTEGRTALLFDQLTAKVSMTYGVKSEAFTLPIDGVDTTRARGELMLYSADRDRMGSRRLTAARRRRSHEFRSYAHPGARRGAVVRRHRPAAESPRPRRGCARHVHHTMDEHVRDAVGCARRGA
jgi:hypothetical protein